MRWTPGGSSPNVIDRRGAGGGGFSFGRGPQIGCGGAIILLVLSLLTGKNFFALFDSTAVTPGPAAVTSTGPVQQTPEEAERYKFLSQFLVDDIQKTWKEVLQKEGIQYQDSQVFIYR